MLVCKNIIKERINTFTLSKEQLKNMSRNNELFCPECEQQLIYCHGKVKVPYFRHKVVCNCTLMGETEEHRQGKVILYKLLKQLFPNSYVDFEYKIEETNQRADVICVHPNEKRVVFEMQCSKIPPEDWEERCRLYESAGIAHYWFAGKKLVKKIEDDGNNSNGDYLYYKLMNLAEEFYECNGYVAFLDVLTEKMHLLYEDLQMNSVFYSKKKFPFISEISLEEIFIEEDKLVTKNIVEMFKQKKEEKRKLAIKLEEERLKEEEERKRWEQERLLERQRIEKRYEEYIEYGNKYVNFIDKANIDFIKKHKKILTDKEKWLLNKLLAKHNFTTNNFPGLFFSAVNYMDLIRTPAHLWQLWIYDTFIHSLKDKKFDKIYVPEVYRTFKIMIQNKTFRVRGSKIEGEHYSFAIYDYIARLARLGLLSQIDSNKKYYKINLYEIPLLDNIRENRYLSKGITLFSVYDDFNLGNHLTINSEEVKSIELTLDRYKLEIDQRKKTAVKRNYVHYGESGITEEENEIDVPRDKNELLEERKIVEYICKLYAMDFNEKLNPNGLKIMERFKSNIQKGELLDKTEQIIVKRIKKEVEERLKMKIQFE